MSLTQTNVYRIIPGIHEVPNVNLLDFMFLLVDYAKVLCSAANELQKNSEY